MRFNVKNCMEISASYYLSFLINGNNPKKQRNTEDTETVGQHPII